MGGNQVMVNLQRSNYVIFVCLLVLLLLVFRADWLAMYSIWVGNETFSHGILIVPITAWLIWKQKSAIASNIGEASVLGLLLLLAGCFGWLLGKLAEANVVAQFGVVTMLVALFPIAFGLKLTWLLAFPILFLFLMVPAGEFIESHLMDYTADAIVVALNWTGIAVFRENMHLTLPTGKWSVVEACSGLRYLIAAIVLAFLFCYLYYKTWTKRILFVAACIFLSILANWVRAYTVVLVGHFSNMKYGTGDDHIYYGWVFFGVVMFAIFWIGMKFRDDDYEPWLTTKSTELAAASSIKKSLVIAVASGLSILGVMQWLNSASQTIVVPAQVFQTQMGKQLSAIGFNAVDTTALSINPVFADPIASTAAKSGTSETFFSAYFANQRIQSQMIRNTNYFIKSGDAINKVLSSRPVQIQYEGRSVTVTEQLVLKPDQSKFLAYSWYCVAGHCGASPYESKAWLAYAMLSGKGDHSTANLYSVAVGEGQREPTTEMLEKLKNVVAISAKVPGSTFN